MNNVTYMLEGLRPASNLWIELARCKIQNDVSRRELQLLSMELFAKLRVALQQKHADIEVNVGANMPQLHDSTMRIHNIMWQIASYDTYQIHFYENDVEFDVWVVDNAA